MSDKAAEKNCLGLIIFLQNLKKSFSFSFLIILHSEREELSSNSLANTNKHECDVVA